MSKADRNAEIARLRAENADLQNRLTASENRAMRLEAQLNANRDQTWQEKAWDALMSFPRWP